MRSHLAPSLIVALATSALSACTGGIDNPDPNGEEPEDPAECAVTRSYTGLGGDALEANRVALSAGTDRLRLKPYAALATEYNRALGITDFSTAAYASTFGAPPARWFREPKASASIVYAAFALGFEGCLEHTATGATYAEAPTAASADPICRAQALRAWNRPATDEEVATCVDYAVNQTPAADGPRRRWAYACAAVLSASGFLAY